MPEPSGGSGEPRGAPVPVDGTAYIATALRLEIDGAVLGDANGPQAEVIRRLIAANLRSVQLAKELLKAQDQLDDRQQRADRAIDRAAASREAADIEQAMCLASATDDAGRRELELSREWALHRTEVYALTQRAEALLRAAQPKAQGRKAVRTPT